MDTNKLLDEIKEYFDVVAERLKDDIKLLAENISDERKTLKDHHKRLGKIEQRLDSVEGTIRANKFATGSGGGSEIRYEEVEPAPFKRASKSF